MSERPITRPWKIYNVTSNESSSWKGLGTASSSSSSMNAVSFGFMATAILISLFLIMAILEHLFRPHSTAPPNSLPAPDRRSLQSSRPSSKLTTFQQPETTLYASGISVVMPGDKYPTCLAKLAPLPCPRAGLHSTPQQHNFGHS